jgi:NAD-dependent deacetylase sirtuin 4
MNPDGDVDMPSLPYDQFRYPACTACKEVETDYDGAHIADGKGVGIMKPMVTFFGESVSLDAKEKADRLVEEADAVVVAGSSLATYSAWRLVKAAVEEGKGIGVVNLGGVRGERELFADRNGEGRLRIEFAVGDVLEGVVEELGGRQRR